MPSHRWLVEQGRRPGTWMLEGLLPKQGWAAEPDEPPATETWPLGIRIVTQEERKAAEHLSAGQV